MMFSRMNPGGSDDLPNEQSVRRQVQTLNVYDFVNILIPTYVESSQIASGDVGVRKMGFHVKRDPIHLGLCRSLFIEPTKSRF